MRLLIAAALLLAGCSKVKWEYQEVEGDETTLDLYGHYGWELVSSVPDAKNPNWTKYTFKRAEGAGGPPDETLVEAKDQGRVFDARIKEIEGK